MDIEAELSTKKDNHIRKVESEVIGDMKKHKSFYRYANKSCVQKTSIGPLRKNNGDITSGKSEKADILSEQYRSVFSTPEEDVLDLNHNGLRSKNGPRLSSIEVDNRLYS